MRKESSEENRGKLRVTRGTDHQAVTTVQPYKASEGYPNPDIVAYCERIIKQGEKVLLLTEKARIKKHFYEPKEFYDIAMKAASAAEKLAVLVRWLPIMSQVPHRFEGVDAMLAEALPVEIGFTEERWFNVRLPMLLPKKEKATREYLNGLIYPVLEKYFDRGRIEVPKFDKCVIIYRHVYAYDRHYRMYRDHDNIEVNQITDAIAMFVMRDDGPTLCSHYHCMGRAPENRTEVYVIPKEDFVKWLSMEPEFPEEGVKLFDPPEYLVENHM